MTWIKANLTALLSAAVVLLTAFQTMKDLGLVSDLQFLALVISTVVVIIVPLVKGKWAGALKTGLDIVGAALVVVIPFIASWASGAPLTRQDFALMIIAVLKAGATELGIQIRTDWGAATPSKLIDAGVAPSDAVSPTPIITSLPASTSSAETVASAAAPAVTSGMPGPVETAS